MSPKRRKLFSIVIPTYYNSGSLPELFQALTGLRRDLAARGLDSEAILVDDGSGDDTLARLRAFRKGRAWVRVVALSRNFGATHASKVGLALARGDVFSVAAADLQDPIPRLAEAVDLWLKGSKFVIFARSSREDPFLNRLFAAVYYWLLRRLVVPDFPPGGYDMALMDGSMLRVIAGSSKSAYTPLLAFWMGHKPAVLHYHRPARRHGRSMWSYAKRIKLFLDIMLGFSITPIRFISGLGAGISVLSIAYAVNMVVHALMGDVPVAGFASLATLISFLMGLVLLMLGIIGEYLWRIFEELNRRPEAVIERID